MLAAKCIPGVELTVGHTSEENGKWPYAGTAAAIEQCGAKHMVKEVTISFAKSDVESCSLSYKLSLIAGMHLIVKSVRNEMHLRAQPVGHGTI